MNELYLAGDIYFSFSFKTSYVNEMEDGRRKQSTLEWENGCIYNAIIKDVDGDIVIQIKGFNKEHRSKYRGYSIRKNPAYAYEELPVKIGREMSERKEYI